MGEESETRNWENEVRKENEKRERKEVIKEVEKRKLEKLRNGFHAALNFLSFFPSDFRLFDWQIE